MKKIMKLISALKTLLFRNDLGRWKNVSQEAPKNWGGRNIIIAEYIAQNSSVFDVGCGDQGLRGLLKDGCEYQPCDLVEKEGVLYCDFNSGIYPKISRRYDYVVLSGVLEYARRPAEVINRLIAHGGELIVSYATLNKSLSKLGRLSKGWINHLTEYELIKLFESEGLTVRKVAEWNGQGIYSLQKKSG